MREKTFIASDIEDIVGIIYAPNKRLTIQIGIGEDIDGKFIETPEQNFEIYTVEYEDLDLFENDPEIALMISNLKTKLWNVVDSTRDKILMERDAKKAEKEIKELKELEENKELEVVDASPQ